MTDLANPITTQDLVLDLSSAHSLLPLGEGSAMRAYDIDLIPGGLREMSARVERTHPAHVCVRLGGPLKTLTPTLSQRERASEKKVLALFYPFRHSSVLKWKRLVNLK